MGIQIQAIDVLGNKKDRQRFIEFPWSVYKNDPNWVPPLKLAVSEMFKPTHPFYERGEIQAFLVSDNQTGETLGRIAAIYNPVHNDFHQDLIGFFGFYEASENPEVTELLFQASRKYLIEKGCTEILGPVNLSTNYECGMLVEGFDDPPQIMMTYNPKYYDRLVVSQNLTKAKDIIAYKMPTTVQMPEVIQRISKRAEKSHQITYRPINKKKWDQEIDLLLEIYNDAWEKNWGFIPMSKEEFRHMAQELKTVANPRFILIAEVAGEAAGFLVCLPDYNQVFKQIPNGSLFPSGLFKLLTPKKRINRVRVITLGIKKKFRMIGLESLLYIKIQEEVLQAGTYTESEMSWILEDNLNMNKPLIRMGADPYKRYRLYKGPLA